MPEDEALQRMNRFLQDMNDQKIDLVGFFDVIVEGKHEDGVFGIPNKRRTMAVIRKK